MRKEFISRLTKNRFKSTKEVRNLFESEQIFLRREEKLHRLRELKVIHKGQFYRIKVPGPRAPSSVTKLLNPSSPPVKGFVHAEKSSSAAVAASSKKHHVQEKAARKTVSSVIAELRQASRTEREEIFQDFWERAKAWWKLNWPVLVLNFGSVCSLVRAKSNIPPRVRTRRNLTQNTFSLALARDCRLDSQDLMCLSCGS